MKPQTAAQQRISRGTPAGGMRTFIQVLVNTALANITTSFLWFALTFWVYIETQSVLATGIIGGAYMLFVAIFSMVFGTIVDRYRKHFVMVLSSLVTLTAFLIAGVIYLAQPESALLDISGPWFWLFSGIILFGGVIENMRNIALSTTVTLLVPVERHANANGMVGMVQGIAFAVTSVLSGLAIGFLGMGWTLAIAIAFTLVALVHIAFLRIPEEKPGVAAGHQPVVDFRGSIRAIRSAPGLFALIIFATFNNLIGGVYMALMDPYGLTIFPVQWWGVVLGVASTGFIIGGIVIAARGLGRNPIRTMLLVVVAMGILGALFTIREWWWLYALGIWLYMALCRRSRQPSRRSSRRSCRSAHRGGCSASPQAFESAGRADHRVPHRADRRSSGSSRTWTRMPARQTWGWLLGDGEARGIALVFLVSGLVMVVAALIAFTTRSYRTLSEEYEKAPAQTTDDAEGGDDAAARSADADANANADADPNDAAARSADAQADIDAMTDVAQFDPRR